MNGVTHQHTLSPYYHYLTGSQHATLDRTLKRFCCAVLQVTFQMVSVTHTYKITDIVPQSTQHLHYECCFFSPSAYPQVSCVHLKLGFNGETNTLIPFVVVSEPQSSGSMHSLKGIQTCYHSHGQKCRLIAAVVIIT